MSFIPQEQYINILENLPILCVDIIVRNTKGEYLLVKRANEPKKGKWWVIGGRVLKGESLVQAARRKVKEETGQWIRDIRPIGYFELINGANPFGLSFEYHTVSVVFTAVTDQLKAVKLDSQSSEFKFSKKLPRDFQVRAYVNKKKDK
jgi:colanic acid biosynthesis protein WcaH